VKRNAAQKLVMDMPSDEIESPYFFYLRAEPDMEIAIEHKDEIVIPPDPAIEYICTNSKCLYFNLSDTRDQETNTAFYCK